MHTKIIDNKDLSANFEPRGALTRTIELPKGLRAEELAQLTPAEINQVIQEIGPAIGYAALARLAAGVGGTPPATQYSAAVFLIERADELEKDRRTQSEAEKGLAGLSQEQLRALARDLEQSGAVIPGEVVAKTTVSATDDGPAEPRALQRPENQ